MTALEILVRARELLTDPDRWIQGEFGLDSDGEAINSARGVIAAAEAGALSCMCMLGALLVAEGTVHGVVLRTDEIEKALGIEFIDRFNDARDRTHAEVLARLDAAIEKLKSQAVQQ